MPTSCVSPPSSMMRSENSVMDPTADVHITHDPAKNSARPGRRRRPVAALGPTLPTFRAPRGRPSSATAAIPAPVIATA